jgi:hypothetical protein
MNWQSIKRFNFTYALIGGAWLQDASGCKSWESFATIEKHMGAGWAERQMKKQGMFTGCWVDVEVIV